MQSDTLASKSIFLHMICTTYSCTGVDRFSLHKDEHSLGCRPEKASQANERPAPPLERVLSIKWSSGLDPSNGEEMIEAAE